MSNLSISYLITCKNETDTLTKLLERVANNKVESDEIIILDDFSDNQKTKEILESIQCCVLNTHVYRHKLNNDYGSHKNFGIEKCKNSWMFQLDSDEIPSETLIFNIREIIDTNKYVELIYVPRINDYRGVTENDARQWGWRLTPSTSIVHEKIIDTESNEYKFLKNNGYILEESKIE